MKDLIIRTVLSLVLTTLPLIPLFLIEPVYEGTDTNVYSFWAEAYIRVFLFFMGSILYYTSRKIVDKFLGEDEIL